MPHKHSVSWCKTTALIFSLLLCTLMTTLASATRSEETLFRMSLAQLLSIEIETLNKRPQSFIDLPAAIYVIERQEIERSGALTVPDLLVRIPGVFVKQVTKEQVAVSIRNNAEYFSTTILVLIDGSPFYFQSTGNTDWGSLPVAVEDIERIEVIRGDGGTVWGTNSSSGIVNILTKAPDTEPRLSLNTTAGNQSMARAHAVTSNSTMRVSANINQDKGWSDNYSSSRNGNALVRHDTTLSDWKTNVTANVYKRSMEDVESTYSGELNEQDTRSYNVNASVSRDLDKDNFQVKFFHYNYKTDLATVEIKDAIFTTSDIEARYLYHISSIHHSHFGLNYRRYGSQLGVQPFVNQTEEKLSDWVTNFTVDHQSQLEQSTKLNLGLRYERSSILKDNDGLWSFSTRLSQQLSEKAVLWGNLQQSWLLPPYQSSNYIALTGVNYYQTGNADLKPERHRSIEIGLRNMFSKDLLLDTSAYYATIKNDATPDPAKITSESQPLVTNHYEPYTNHLKSTSWGLELLLDWNVANTLHTQWGITYFRKKLQVQDGIDRGAINDQYAPQWKLNLNTQFHYSSKADISLMLLYETAHNYTSNNVYIDNGEADDHFRLDGGINYKFIPRGKLSLGFKNLFNSGTEWKLSTASAQPQEVEPSVHLNLSYFW